MPRLPAPTLLPAAVTLIALTLPVLAEAVEVSVRTGRHADFERVVFDWPKPVTFRLERSADGLVVLFEDGASFAVETHPDAAEALLGDLALPEDADARRVLLSTDSDVQARSFTLPDHRVVIDLMPDDNAQADKGADSEAASTEPASRTPAFQEALYRRDLMIASMLRRLERIERGVPLPETGSLEEIVAGDVAPSAVEPAAGQVSSTPQGATDAEGQPIDPTLVARALERSLTRDGVLLLPTGTIEVEPGLSYQRSKNSGPVFVTNGDPLVVFIGEDEVERDEVTANLDLRLGLPLDSQLELHLPYRYVDQRTRTMVGMDLAAGDSGSGHGLGDLRVALAKTLKREQDWWPDVVGRVSWDSATGKTRDSGVALGGGFHEFGTSLAAVKRQDPLAFVGSISLETTLEEDDVEPGNALGFSFGAVLAASPRTSLRFAVAQQFVGETAIDGDDISGSDLRTATLSLGAASVLGQNALLDLALDVGLSDDAPDYALRLAVPVRFNLPFL